MHLHRTPLTLLDFDFIQSKRRINSSALGLSRPGEKPISGLKASLLADGALLYFLQDYTFLHWARNILDEGTKGKRGQHAEPDDKRQPNPQTHTATGESANKNQLHPRALPGRSVRRRPPGGHRHDRDV